MNPILRTSACAVLLSLTQCQAELSDIEETSQGLASPENGDDRDCGADGVCNISQCTNDPDCPNQSGGNSVTWGLTGTSTPTDVSGFATSDCHTLGNANSAVNAVYALLSQERSDDPCYLALGIENVNDATVDTVPELDLCGSGGRRSSILHADYLDISAGGSGDHNFVSGVRVCMNGNDDKVKGIEVLGRQLTSSGTLVNLGALGSDPRPHCDHWESWVECDPGQIATAVDACFDGGSTYDSLVGIALRCRALTVN